jgi:hypothetical protein
VEREVIAENGVQTLSDESLDGSLGGVLAFLSDRGQDMSGSVVQVGEVDKFTDLGVHALGLGGQGVGLAAALFQDPAGAGDAGI